MRQCLLHSEPLPRHLQPRSRCLGIGAGEPIEFANGVAEIAARERTLGGADGGLRTALRSSVDLAYRHQRAQSGQRLRAPVRCRRRCRAGDPASQLTQPSGESEVARHPNLRGVRKGFGGSYKVGLVMR